MKQLTAQYGMLHLQKQDEYKDTRKHKGKDD